MRSYIVKRSSADHVDTILLILGQCTCKVYFYDLGRCWVSHVQWVFVTVDCAYTKGNLSTLGAKDPMCSDLTESIGEDQARLGSGRIFCAKKKICGPSMVRVLVKAESALKRVFHSDVGQLR